MLLRQVRRQQLHILNEEKKEKCLLKHLHRCIDQEQVMTRKCIDEKNKNATKQKLGKLSCSAFFFSRTNRKMSESCRLREFFSCIKIKKGAKREKRETRNTVAHAINKDNRKHGKWDAHLLNNNKREGKKLTY